MRTETAVSSINNKLQSLFDIYKDYFNEIVTDDNQSLREFLAWFNVRNEIFGKDLLFPLKEMVDAKIKHFLKENADSLRKAVDTNGQSALYTAVVNQDLALVKLVVDALYSGENAKDIDKLRTKSQNATPLMCAVSLKKQEIANLLIDAGANFLLELSDKPVSAYWMALSLGLRDVVTKILEKGGKIDQPLNENNAILRTAGLKPDGLAYTMMKTLLQQSPEEQELFEIAYTSEEKLTSHILETYPIAELIKKKQLDEINSLLLKLCGIALAIFNSKKFKSADSIFNFIQTLTTVRSSHFSAADEGKESNINQKNPNFSTNSKCVFSDDRKTVEKARLNEFLYLLSLFSENPKYQFPHDMSSDRKTALKKAFRDIVSFFENPTQCLASLKKLDEQIFEQGSCLGFNFSLIKPGKPMSLFGDLCFPENNPDNTLIPNTLGLLHYLLREKLQKHGIEQQNELYTFSGFVDSQKADEVIKRGALFKEQFLMGNALMHGVYSHYLQLYLIAEALENRVITLDDGLTLKELLAAFITVKVLRDDNASSVWTTIIDTLSRTQLIQIQEPTQFYFGSPHRLQSALLYSPELPNLRGLLLNHVYRKLDRYKEMVNISFNGKTVSDRCIIGAMAVSFHIFNLCDIDITNADVNSYYLKMPSNIKRNFDQKTGIMTTSAKEKFRILKERLHNAHTQRSFNGARMFSIVDSKNRADSATAQSDAERLRECKRNDERFYTQ